MPGIFDCRKRPQLEHCLLSLFCDTEPHGIDVIAFLFLLSATPAMSPTSTVALDHNTCSSTPDWKVVATQHPDFWFSDGSIVLCVDKALFRVHQTILGKHSEVFEDLFTLPQPIQEEEMVEGCRVVMLHDSKEEFGDLLNAIYDPSYASILIHFLHNAHCQADISMTYHPTSTLGRYSILSVVSSNSAQNISFVRSVNGALPF